MHQVRDKGVQREKERDRERGERGRKERGREGANDKRIGISGDNSADSWIDVKGNNCTITENIGYQSGVCMLLIVLTLFFLFYPYYFGLIILVVDTTKFYAGYQTHQRSTGWGFYNIFSKNIGIFETNFTGFLIDVFFSSLLHSSLFIHLFFCANIDTGGIKNRKQYSVQR